MTDAAPLFRCARTAISAALVGERYHAPPLDPPWYEARGVFVTLWKPDGRLRGCIGHVEPYCRHLAEEIATCAVSAATRDPRFPPVTADELANLTMELSILQPPEPATRDQLDAVKYGIVLSAGKKRGVLLPDVAQDVDEQISITLRKAEIEPTEPYSIERFTVTKLHE